jgi:hypothetical protein
MTKESYVLPVIVDVARLLRYKFTREFSKRGLHKNK